MTLDAGQHLGRYKILSLLGSGGMGDVYRAHDTRLDREVALKFLKPTSTGRDAAAVMAEARAASALSHANVCQLHEVDEAGGHTFLVMELVEGQTLAAAIANGPLAADRVTRYGAQIAAALDHAHQRGIVHGLKQRDEAFRWLEQAYNERYGPLALLNVDPDLDLLRDDPRFAELVRKVGLRPGR